MEANFGPLIILFSLSLLISSRVQSEPTGDKQALLAFITQTPHSNRIQWNASESACKWIGVECDATNSYVYSLRLPGSGLFGKIPANTIGRLNQLRILSLRSNRLSSEIPSDFGNLTLLRSLYLMKNNFSGDFPVSLTRLERLVRLDLSSNNFTGEIPLAINNLTRLKGLFLENNGFSGSLPNIVLELTDFNVSNNKLNGSIPEMLKKFNASSFDGNVDLCGGPLPPCGSFSPSPSPWPPNPVHVKSRKLSTAAIVLIAVGSALLALLLFILLLCCLQKRNRSKSSKASKPAVAATRAVPYEAETSSSKDITSGSMEVERKKLVFFNGGNYSFDLEDLLRASAEVLGKGSVGTSYKAMLEEGTTVVVKRLKDATVSKREFDVQMEILGKIKHENVAPPRAFYYSKDEKLLVFDFIAAGSMSALLHGSRGSSRRSPLDWDNRRKIAESAARGLAHLHVSAKLVHGNIKSSNILLLADNEACVSDYGLTPIFGNVAPPNRVTGYRAPEVVETRKATFKSDVYSFGVLLLELLTGKAPNQASLGEEGIDLPRWVQSVVHEEWTAEVFDAELIRYSNIEEEMVQLLQIAIACVSTVPDQRPSMQEVVQLIEDINRSEIDDGLRQSSGDHSKGSGGYTPIPPRSVTP